MMARIRRMHKMPFDLTQQGFFAHDPKHSLMVHLPSISLQGMGHPAIAIAWKVQNDLFYGITQGHCFFQRGFHIWVVLPLVVPGTIDLQLLRETTDGNGEPRLTAVLDHRMPLVKGSLPNASDRISIFRENSYMRRSLLLGRCTCQR